MSRCGACGGASNSEPAFNACWNDINYHSEFKARKRETDRTAARGSPLPQTADEEALQKRVADLEAEAKRLRAVLAARQDVDAQLRAIVRLAQAASTDGTDEARLPGATFKSIAFLAEDALGKTATTTGSIR